MQFTALISNKQVHRITGCLWVSDGFEKSPHAGLKPSSCGGGGQTWKRPGGGGLNTDSSGAISLSALLEEFQSPHYHFIWFHSTHLSSPHTRMDHITVCELSRNATPGPTTSPSGRKGNRLCSLKLNCTQQEPKLLSSTPYFIKTPTERPLHPQSSVSAFPTAFQGGWNRKHLGITINDLSSQTGESTCGFNAGNIY